jgi:very-short-patch-repair endonuclease
VRVFSSLSVLRIFFRSVSRAKLGPRIPREMKARSRSLRKESTVPEQILWNMLRNRRLGGLKFRRQDVRGFAITDYCCPSAMLVVELDGMSHVGQGDADDRRTEQIEAQGYRVIRFTNDEVLQSAEAEAEAVAVATAIARAAGLDW